MKTIIFILCFATWTLSAQEVFENIHNSYQSFTGGPYGSPTSAIIEWKFIAREKVVLENVVFENKKLSLEQGDTVVFSFGRRIVVDSLENSMEDKVDTSINWIAVKNVLTSNYLINVPGNTVDWELARQFTYLGRTKISHIKQNWDVYERIVAP